MLYNTKVADPLFYKNIIIWKATKNTNNMKYYSYTNNGIIRSDTLTGIKKLINIQ